MSSFYPSLFADTPSARLALPKHVITCQGVASSSLDSISSSIHQPSGEESRVDASLLPAVDPVGDPESVDPIPAQSTHALCQRSAHVENVQKPSEEQASVLFRKGACLADVR
jgi:hypothetical protein